MSEMMPRQKRLGARYSRKSRSSVFSYRIIPILLMLVLTSWVAPLHANGASKGLSLQIIRNPDIIQSYLVGSYSHNVSGSDQISVQSADPSGGAVAVSWSLGVDFTNVSVVRLSFQLMTTALRNGTYGARVGSLVALATSSSACCPSDRSALFSKDSKEISVATDCCYDGANLFFGSTLWVNPDASLSGDRITKVLEKKVPGYADDTVFHSYTVEMNLTSETTIWTVDSGNVTTYTGFTFAPSYLVFWAQGHDPGDYAVAQMRNVRMEMFTIESGGSSPNPQPTSQLPPVSPYSQWWFWTIIGLGGLSAILASGYLTRGLSRKKGQSTLAKSEGQTCPQCGVQMPLGSLFCGKCGLKFAGGAI